MWNDFHWVPNTFFLTRHGLTRHFSNGMSLTAGYAWVRTSASFTDRLPRQEYRPWAQWELPVWLSPRSNYRFRLRYDCRFRKRLSSLRVEEDFIYQNRTYLLWGLGVGEMTFLTGYHLRVVPGRTQTSFHHGLTFWIVQRFGV